MARKTLDEIRSAGEVKPGAGKEEMVTVRVLVQGFRDNGHDYDIGQTAHMEISMVPPAIEAGQVELVPKEST